MMEQCKKCGKKFPSLNCIEDIEYFNHKNNVNKLCKCNSIHINI